MSFSEQSLPEPANQPGLPPPHVVVVGNEKGGTGKSTTAMHIATGLMRDGYAVALIDLDARQGTTTGFFRRRGETAERLGVRLPMAEVEAIQRSGLPDRLRAERAETEAVEATIARLGERVDVIVIDTPGNDTALSRAAHARADTLITPLNDSFIDLDVLAQVDPDTLEIVRPSFYAEMVWEQRKRRAIADRGSIDWIVMRNRLSQLDARNKRDVGQILEKLARRIGFRLLDGFGERVIFRELYLQGLTLMDLKESGVTMTLSHVAARQEVRALIDSIDLDGVHRGRRSYLSQSRG